MLAALDKAGPTPGVYWVSKPKGLLAEEFLRFLLSLPSLPMPRVVVLDNGSLHRNHLVKAALPELWTKGIYLYYLPPYSPELNDFESLFRQVKHQEMPKRSYSTISALESAVDHAFTHVEDRVIAKCRPEPRLAA